MKIRKVIHVEGWTFSATNLRGRNPLNDHSKENQRLPLKISQRNSICIPFTRTLAFAPGRTSLDSGDVDIRIPLIWLRSIVRATRGGLSGTFIDSRAVDDDENSRIPRACTTFSVPRGWKTIEWFLSRFNGASANGKKPEIFLPSYIEEDAGANCVLDDFATRRNRSFYNDSISSFQMNRRHFIIVISKNVATWIIFGESKELYKEVSKLIDIVQSWIVRWREFNKKYK